MVVASWAVVMKTKCCGISYFKNKYHKETMVLSRWAVVGEKDHQDWMRSVLLHQAQASLPGSRLNAMIHHFISKFMIWSCCCDISIYPDVWHTMNSGPEWECCQKCLKIHIFMGDQLWEQVCFYLTYANTHPILSTQLSWSFYDIIFFQAEAHPIRCQQPKSCWWGGSEEVWKCQKHQQRHVLRRTRSGD